jgi:hypothetical protein
MFVQKSITLLTTFALSITFANAQSSLNKIWETPQLPVPESVLYSEKEDQLLVSLIDGEGNKKDGKGGIAILGTDGSIKNKTWVEGLHAPKGLARYKNVLFVADLTALVSIDIPSGKILNTLEIDSAVFLNDVTVDAKGVVFVSDTRINTIHRVKDGKQEVYLRNVKGPNGLKWIKKNLYVLASTELIKVDEKKRITVVAKGLEKSGDGLEQLANGDFIATCWPGIIYHIKANGELNKLQDVQGQMNTADLGYNPKTGIIYIPTFNQNSVIAYKLSDR